MASDTLYYIVHTRLREQGLPAFYTGSLTANGEPVLTDVTTHVKLFTRADAEAAIDNDLDASAPIANESATVWDIVPTIMKVV